MINKLLKNVVYSVDMVRLQTFGLDIDVELFFNQFKNNPLVAYKFMTGISAYKHNFTFQDAINYEGEIATCSFWVGICQNAMRNNPRIADITLEYNPNKCKCSRYLNMLLNRFFVNSPLTIIKSFDLAIDLPVNIKTIFAPKVGNIGYKYFDNGGDNITHYYRARNTHGHIKIYNKSRELGLENVDMTRYEITLKPKIELQQINFYHIDSELFIPLKIADSFQFDLSLCGTDLVLLLTCLEYPERLNLLSRRKKESINSYINGFLTNFEFDLKKIENTITTYFSTLLQQTQTILNYYAECENVILAE